MLPGSATPKKDFYTSIKGRLLRHQVSAATAAATVGGGLTLIDTVSF